MHLNQSCCSTLPKSPSPLDVSATDPKPKPLPKPFFLFLRVPPSPNCSAHLRNSGKVPSSVVEGLTSLSAVSKCFARMTRPTGLALLAEGLPESVEANRLSRPPV